MSSLSRRYRLAQSEVAELLPPNLASMGDVLFGVPQRARLTAWLSEAGWPREHMGIPELEGYLVALIVWPVDIPSGAWLPPIWGERGWKIPPQIATTSRYEEFLALIVGFMRKLDSDVCGQTLFESSALRGLLGRERVVATRRWGSGFTKALSLGSQGLKWRDASARAAVRMIANSSSDSGSISSGAPSLVFKAVASLAEQRSSRGPLGILNRVPTRADSL